MLREQRGQRYPPDKRNSCAAAGTLTYICRPWHRAQLSLLKASNIPWKRTCRLDQSGQVLSIGGSDLELTEWYRGHCLKRSGMNGISNSDAFVLRRRLQPSSSQPLGLCVTTVLMTLEGAQVCKMDHPPFSIGSLLARRCVTVPQSVATISTFIPSRLSRS